MPGILTGEPACAQAAGLDSGRRFGGARLRQRSPAPALACASAGLNANRSYRIPRRIFERLRVDVLSLRPRTEVMPTEPDRISDAYERAIAAERARSALRLNALRLAMLSVFVVLAVVFRLVEPDWIGPVRVLAIYWVLALAVYTIFRDGPRAAAASAWLLPFMDVPMTFWLMQDNASRLTEAGFGAQAQLARTVAGAFFLVIVSLSSLALEVRRVFVVAAAAMFAEAILLELGEPDLTWVVFLPVTIAVAAVLAAYGVGRSERLVREVVDEQRRREKLGRYFPPQVAAHIESVSEEKLAAGESREVTLLFVDIRNFTRLAEGLSGPETVALLNEFHAAMVEAIFRENGTLDKFMGDGLMAYFGAPLADSEHPTRAVRAAIDMVARLDDLNRSRNARGLAALGMGIGIHTGPVVLGDIGAPSRREFTAIGNAVNVASRLQQATRDQSLTVLVSDATRSRLPAAIELRNARPAVIRGLEAPVECWTLRARDSPST
jgi:adenylate cyclase